MSDPKREFALVVVRRLREAGYEALWAGGCVRDLILGATPSDYDVATNALPNQVMGLFRRTIPVGVSFGVVRVRGPKAAGGEVEVATFRSDGEYRDGRRPESVVYGTPREDASRRDFTINGMFLDPLTDRVIDYVGGRQDLDARVLRAIGDPAARFEEDKLRLLRAVRFAARFDFSIESRTREALVDMAVRVRMVAAERIAQELTRILLHPGRARGIALAFETGVLGAVLPDLLVLKGSYSPDGGSFSGDRWEHTLAVLAALPSEINAAIGFAALMHASDEPADVMDRAARELKLSNADRERAVWLVANQSALKDAASMPRSRLKPLLAHPGREELLTLVEAIGTVLGETGDAAYCRRYIRQLPEGPLDPPPLLTGADLRAAGMTPGPRFKDILDAARTAQLDGEVVTKDEAMHRFVRPAAGPSPA